MDLRELDLTAHRDGIFNAPALAGGDEFCVLVRETASTGYRWELTPSSGVEVIDDDVQSLDAPSEHPELVGGGRDRLLLLRRLAGPPTTVELRRRRSFSGEQAGHLKVALSGCQGQ